METKRMDDCITLPALFTGAKEYKDDPNALEMAQATFNEEALYRAIEDYSTSWYASTGRPARVLDLCAATGLCTFRVSQRVPVASATLVDTDENALDHAAKRLSAISVVKTETGDSAKFTSSERYDLVLANSAYHHIADHRKIEFLKIACSAVADDGAILIGEHFLPPYNSQQEFRNSVETFYRELIAELQRRNEPTGAIDVIRRSALYCWLGEYEFKVSWPVFQDHCISAHLQACRVRKIWEPEGGRGTGAGTMAIWLQPRGQPPGGIECHKY
jgi:predicted O-methyltransferase YrrM